eukprot:15366348-Ditylum_brightwellii.AAC.2
MKINAKSLKFANSLVGNRPPPILFYVLDSNKKLSPSNYQTYKLRTNPKDKKFAVYSLTVKYYKVGTPEEWFQFVNAIAQGDALQVFQNEEESQYIKDSLAFTKCLAVVTEHVFPKKAYKIQKNTSGTSVNP